MWKLAGELLTAFEDPLPEKSILFKETTTQLTREGYQLFFTCYRKGVARLEEILRQDVELTEQRVTRGRRKIDLKLLKEKNLRNITDDVDEVMEDLTEDPVVETMLEEQVEHMEIDPMIDEIDETNKTNVSKKARHKPTPQEKEILSELDQYDGTFLPTEFVNNLKMRLKEHTDHWEGRRLYDHWHEKHIRKKK